MANETFRVSKDADATTYEVTIMGFDFCSDFPDGIPEKVKDLARKDLRIKFQGKFRTKLIKGKLADTPENVQKVIAGLAGVTLDNVLVDEWVPKPKAEPKPVTADDLIAATHKGKLTIADLERALAELKK